MGTCDMALLYGYTNTVNELDLTDIHRAFCTPTAESTFFSNAHRLFMKTDHILGYKPNHKKVKRMEITQKMCEYVIKLN